MLRFVPYIVKNLLGHRVRTGMTVVGAAALMFLFCFVSSAQEGLHRLTNPSEQDSRLIVFQAYSVCPSTSNLPARYDPVIRKVPGVKDALPVKVRVNNCRASTDSVVFNGVPVGKGDEPDILRDGYAPWPIEKLVMLHRLRLVEGSAEAFVKRREGGALVGRKLAQRRNLKVGSQFTAAGLTVYVDGIFVSDQAGRENVVYTHLGYLLHSVGHHEEARVTHWEVFPENPADAAALGQRIDEALAEGLTETRPQKMFYQRALSDLIELIDLTRLLGFACVGVVIVLVANSVIMAAQDRVKEHAVLQTLGYPGWLVGLLMMAESMLLSLVGGAIGIAGCFAWLRLRPIAVSTEGVSIDLLPTPALALIGFGLSALVGLAAAAVPAWQAGRAEIVSSLRRV